MRLENLWFLCILFYSCQTESGFSGDITIDVGSKRKAYIGQVGLSSNLPFPKSTNPNDVGDFLIFNPYSKFIDSVSFKNEEIKIFQGFFLEEEGPEAIGEFNFFLGSSLGFVFVGNRSIVIKDLKSGEIKKVKFSSDIFGEKSDTFLPGSVSFLLDHFFKGFDAKKENLYFFVQNMVSGEVALCKFNIITEELIRLPDFFDVDMVSKNENIYRNQLYIMKNNLPYVFYYDEKLILSYSYSNEIVVVNPESLNFLTKYFDSKLFPNEKSTHQKLRDDMDFFEANQTMDEWDFDVSFGNLEKLPNNKGFCRLIRGATLGEDKKNPEIFIEIFDNELKKVGEANLTNMQPDLSTFFFAVERRLFFKAKEQPDENYLNYYFVEVDF
ncbi:hypothetical protein [Cecembia sp.]|uniref:hypothetical protein n=1 Tax=Cecembia sp. TaxID=1898110 RepID=UPI0025C6C359|nr:hypothetical protein [Cecembia sp.]